MIFGVLIAVILTFARRRRADIGSADLTALLSGLLFAIRPRDGADPGRVLSVFRDGLRPQAPT